MIMTYLIVSWFIGAVLAIRVVKTKTFPTEDIARELLNDGDYLFLIFIWGIFPIMIILYILLNIPYYTHYLIFEKEWRKKK